MSKMTNKDQQIFLEDLLKIRIKGKPGKESSIGIASKNNTLPSELEDVVDAGNFVDTTAFQQFRTLGSDRNEQYRMYDEMSTDSIIAAALELYSDDATQYNTKGQVIWVESEDPTIAQWGNRLIDNLQLNDNAWSYVYCLVKYGEVYLQLFKDDEIDDDPLSKRLGYTDIDIMKNRKGSVLEDYIEKVPNPARLFDLSSRGKTVGFVEVELYDNEDDSSLLRSYMYNTEDQNIKIYDPKKFVHIMLSPNTERFPEKLSLTFENRIKSDTDASKAMTIKTYDVKRGKSILYDLYKIYREIQLMEDSLLLNRVTRSSIIRFLQIEIGDMPEDKATMVLHRYKRLIEQKNFLDKDQGKFTSAANPGPIDNVLYIPTREGKGAVSMSNLGGDVDVKAITDVDYFKNKLYGGLKIPRQFLGETDEGGGFSGGTSLTKLDARYARTIKRIQNALITGVTTLLNLFALDRGQTDYINNFTVKMLSPSTTEDAERDETLDTRINIVDRLLTLIPDESVRPKTKKDMLVYYMSNYLSETEVAQMLEDDTTLDEVPKEKLDDIDMSTNLPSGGSMRSNDIDIDMDMPNNEPDIGGGEGFDMGSETSTAEPDLGGSEFDFSDVEL